MFRKLLESNGYTIKVKNTGLSSQAEQVMSIGICPDGICIGEYMVIAYYQDVKDYQIEQACMQYCIENGVRLEWLGFNPTIQEHKFTNWIYQNDIPKLKIDKETKTVKEIFADEKGTLWGTSAKLFAAIYAHDIKIIE